MLRNIHVTNHFLLSFTTQQLQTLVPYLFCFFKLCLSKNYNKNKTSSVLKMAENVNLELYL